MSKILLHFFYRIQCSNLRRILLSDEEIEKHNIDCDSLNGYSSLAA